jgi:chondroitin AC lyase
MIQKAAQSIADEIMISENEGIQPDYSFHQHGHQLQFGNYGLSYGSDMIKWASIFEGTEFAFSPAKIEILRGYLRNGLRWMVWHDRFDISGCGRQLFQNAQIGKARNVAAIFAEAQAADPAYANQYKTDLQNLTGNTHFWRSDMTVHRRDGFYASVKMSSNRVKGYEVINSENIQGYHTGDGATIFYQSGDEYTDIFPFWDWKKIPGITAYQDNGKLPMTNESKNKSDFVGGVSDGNNGIAVLNLNRDSLMANKSWFFFNDAVICLGSGITAGLNKDVSTTVNQSLLKGSVLVSSNGKVSEISKGDHDLKKINWILHDNWWYYFPGTSSLHLENQERKGAWNRVVAPMSSHELTTEIFQVNLDHGLKPSDAAYAYYVFPAAQKNTIRKRAKAIKIITNNKDRQAVMTTDGKFSGVIFYKPSNCQLGRLEINSSAACVVLLSSEKNKLQLSVSDPTHLQKNLQLSLSGKYILSESGIAEYDSMKNCTVFFINLPQKGEAGKTIVLNLIKK